MWNNIKNGASQMIKTGFGGFVHRAFTGTATGATFSAGGMAESMAAAAAGIATTAFGGGAVGAAMGAGGELAGQGYLISQGYQNSFNWKQFGKTTCGAVIAGTAMGAAFGAAGQTKAGSRFFQWLETPTQFEQNAAKGIKQFLGDNRGTASIEALLGKGGSETLDKLKQYIRTGEVKENNIISQIDDTTKILFRKDTGEYAHPIKLHGYDDNVNHYNIEVQTKTTSGKWKSKWSYHIILDDNNNIIEAFD